MGAMLTFRVSQDSSSQFLDIEPYYSRASLPPAWSFWLREPTLLLLLHHKFILYRLGRYFAWIRCLKLKGVSRFEGCCGMAKRLTFLANFRPASCSASDSALLLELAYTIRSLILVAEGQV